MFIKKAVAVAGLVLALGLVGCGGDDDNPLTPNHFNSNIEYGSFTDSRDGKTYRTVIMPDGKTWMAQNLNYQTSDSWCYDNKPANCAAYGRLYTWNAAMAGASSSNNVPSGVQGVCPSGWRLPSSAEWDSLMTAVGGSSGAGRKLKSLTGWYGGGNGTDEYGFSALPGSTRWSDGDFYGVGYYGSWWSATEGDATGARFRYMYFGHGDVIDIWDDKALAYSVRCLSD